jgi:hypothetical protein
MGDSISPRWTRTTTTRALSTKPMHNRRPRRSPCLTSGPDFCHSAPFETHAFGLMLRANGRGAKSDFLSVVQQLKWLQRLFVSRPKQSPGPSGLAIQPIRNSGNFSSWNGRKEWNHA